MKRLLKIVWGLLVTLSFLGCGTGTAVPEKKPLYYVNPMDPTVRSDIPAKDPMGMDYIAVFDQVPDSDQIAAEESPSSVIARVSVKEVQASLIGLSTAVVTKRSWTSEMKAVGKVVPNENQLVHISARYSGRVERLFASYAGVTVRENEPLLEIYSPELIGAQQELIQLSDSSTDGMGKILFEKSREKLRLWGLTNAQIQRILSSGTPLNSVPVLSPLSGTVLSKEVTSGMYITEGEMLFDVADLSRLWLEVELFEQDILKVKLGSILSLTTAALPGKTLKVPVNFISPSLDPVQRTFKIRADLNNAEGVLKPNMFFDVAISTVSGRDFLTIPQSAVLDSGARKIVYVHLGAGRYEGRKVIVGDRSKDTVAIIEGLAEGEEVVANGLFLLDSQAQLSDTKYRRN